MECSEYSCTSSCLSLSRFQKNKKKKLKFFIAGRDAQPPLNSKISSAAIRGNFNALNLPQWDREMIESAYQAVESVPGGWDFLKTYDPGDGGFMFSTPPPKMVEIDKAVNDAYGGHS